MSTGTPYIGSKISLISRAKIRYEGYLYTIDTDESTVTLAKVQSLGTEERLVDKKVPARDEIYEYIVFRGKDIEDLHVCEGPKSRSQVPVDPAIVQTGSTSQPNMYSQMQTQMPSQFAPNYNPFGGMTAPFNYSFGFRPQAGVPVATHHHSSNLPPISNFSQKDTQSDNGPNRVPSPAPANAAPGAKVSQKEAREEKSSERQPEKQRQEKRGGERSEGSHKERKKEEKSRDRDKDRDRGDKDHRKSKDYEKETRKEKSGHRDRDTGREQTRDTRDNEGEIGRRRDGNRVNDHRRNRERDNDRNYAKDQHRGRDQDHDREPQERQRRGSGSGSRGRRPGRPNSTRNTTRSGSYPKPKFDEDFDFETANAKFNKDEIEKELLGALKKNLIVKDEDEDVIVEKETTKNSVDEDKDEDEQDGLPSPAKYYDPSKSFFDNISCEAMEVTTTGNRNSISFVRRQERERNVETFGPPPRGYRGRGRPHRGRGFRGGRGRGYSRGRGSYRGSYGRNSGSRGWVDYDFDYKSAGIDVPVATAGDS